MNYRHHYHAGNYADVMKHALLVQLVRGLQRKERGFLYLDTHAGRGRYDLAAAAAGESLARKPEWPDGIGRLWPPADAAHPAGVTDYLELIRAFDREAGNLEATPRFYPGSPLIVRRLARPVDRLALCEKHPEEFSALQTELGQSARTSLHESDGYAALRAMLPPPERRALILIDPPFEAQDEFAQMTAAIAAGLKRFPSGVFVAWYPLTVRARVDEFLHGIHDLNPPPTVAMELAIAGEFSALKMKGCGVVVINPPWQLEASAHPLLTYFADVLAQEPGGSARIEWIVRESTA
jgi:23S rRNA (adenine2030-N6)-methyltransferase